MNEEFNSKRLYDHLSQRGSIVLPDTIANYGDNDNIMHQMIFIWQQNVSHFYSMFKGTEFMDYFKSHFKDIGDQKIFFRGVIGNYKQDRDIISTSSIKQVALNFATIGCNSLYLINDFTKPMYVIEYTATKILQCDEYGIVDNEAEVLLLDPVMVKKHEIVIRTRNKIEHPEFDEYVTCNISSLGMEHLLITMMCNYEKKRVKIIYPTKLSKWGEIA